MQLQSIATYLTTSHPFFTLFLVGVGALKLFNLLDSFVNVVLDTVLPRQPDVKSYKHPKQDTYAVVTGCTAGIGEEYAKQLSNEGFKLILIGRTESKLKALQSELKTESKIFVLDFETAKEENFSQLKNFLQGLPVSILINNAGISHEMPTPFALIPEEEIHAIMQVNCVSTLAVTRAVLPAITEYTNANKKARALILTMGSFAGLTPTPLLSVYSGSKAFLQGWSSALGAELGPKRIDVKLVISYLVTSKMSKIRKTSVLVTDPVNFVRSTLRQLRVKGGAQERAYTLTPYWSHALMHWGIENVLGVYSKLVSKVNYDMHVSVRNRALKKKEQRTK